MNTTTKEALLAQALLVSEHERKMLRAALELFAKMDTADLGNAALNAIRDGVMEACPEYIGYCKQARAALAKAKA